METTFYTCIYIYIYACKKVYIYIYIFVGVKKYYITQGSELYSVGSACVSLPCTDIANGTTLH